MIFLRIYQVIRFFSLDIIAGAIASLVFAASVMGIHLSLSYYVIMGVTVWLIYTTDHLMDGAKTRGKSESATHNFFYKYRVPIILVSLMVLVFDFRLIMYRLDEKIIEFAIAPGLAAVVYLVLNRYYENAPKWFFIKEIWIAIIYTIAIWGGPVIYAGDQVNTLQLLLIAAFTLIIFSNVLLFSIYEREKDAKEGNKSFVSDFGLSPAMNITIFALILAILLALTAYIFLSAGLMFCLPVILISAMLLVILTLPKVFSVGNLYGIAADLLLLLFLLVLND